MWKHAQPLSTDFAWLPEDVAQAFCSLACARIKLASMVRSTRYSWDLMNIIRLGYISRDYITWARPGAWKSLESSAKCRQRGFVLDVEYNRTDETFGLLPPQERGKLFEATLRLMRLMLVDEPMDVTDDEEQLGRALMPLVHNRDGHFLATLSALLLSLLEGKTDCPISGVFGAGKTRAAAAIISGLITVDPSLKIMILTKENVASQAFAEHIIGFSLPTWIERKFGRLVGFMALQNQTTSSTRLDVPTAHRHDVLRTKQVIIGCGGGFRHECASKYSPMRVKTMGIWTKQQPLPVYRAIAWCFGLVTIVKLRAVSENPLRPGKGYFERCHIMCRYDSTARAPCTNENWLAYRRSRIQLPGTFSR